MAFCTECGTQMSDQAQACPSCGAPTAARTATAYAPTYPGQTYGLPPYGAGSLADPGQRLVARIIDGLIVGVGFIALTIVMSMFGAALGSIGPSEIGGFFAISGILGIVIVAFGYEIVFIATRGQTPGKMVMSIKVVRTADGQIPDWGASFLRWIVPIAMSLLPFGGFLDALWLLWDDNRQCLHDKAANTLVIRTR
jgi:uncharacterized RDD family membrane protein YckC